MTPMNSLLPSVLTVAVLMSGCAGPETGESRVWYKFTESAAHHPIPAGCAWWFDGCNVHAIVDDPQGEFSRFMTTVECQTDGEAFCVIFDPSGISAADAARAAESVDTLSFIEFDPQPTCDAGGTQMVQMGEVEVVGPYPASDGCLFEQCVAEVLGKIEIRPTAVVTLPNGVECTRYSTTGDVHCRDERWWP